MQTVARFECTTLTSRKNRRWRFTNSWRNGRLLKSLMESTIGWDTIYVRTNCNIWIYEIILNPIEIRLHSKQTMMNRKLFLIPMLMCLENTEIRILTRLKRNTAAMCRFIGSWVIQMIIVWCRCSSRSPMKMQNSNSPWQTEMMWMSFLRILCLRFPLTAL